MGPRPASLLACALGLVAGCAGEAAPAATPDAHLAAINAEATRAAALTDRDDARSAWIRITSVAIAALPSLVPEAAVAATSQTIPIPPTRQGDFSVCPRGGCTIAVVPEEGAALLPAGADSVAIELRARATTSSIPVAYTQTWPCMGLGRPECAIDLDTRRSGPPYVGARATIRLAAAPDTGWIAPSIGAFTISTPIDASDIQIGGTNACGGVWCSVANIAGASSFLAGAANDALGRGLHDATAHLPSPLAGRFVLESADRNAEADLAFAVADEVHIVPNALDLALRIAAVPSRQHRCVPAAPEPPSVSIPAGIFDAAPARPPAPRGNAPRDRTTAASPPPPAAPLPPSAPIAASIALGDGALARVLWSIHQSGVLCADVGPDRIPQLSPTALGVLLPAAAHLAPLGVRTPSVSIRPLAPPRVRFEPDGTLRVSIDRLRIELWADVAARPLRLAAADLDAELPVTIADGRDGLVLRFARDHLALHVRTVWGAPALGATEPDLRALFEGLAGLAGESLPERLALAAPPADPHAPDATDAPASDGLASAAPWLRRLRLARPPHRSGDHVLVIDLAIAPAAR